MKDNAYFDLVCIGCIAVIFLAAFIFGISDAGNERMVKAWSGEKTQSVSVADKLMGDL